MSQYFLVFIAMLASTNNLFVSCSDDAPSESCCSKIRDRLHPLKQWKGFKNIEQVIDRVVSQDDRPHALVECGASLQGANFSASLLLTKKEADGETVVATRIENNFIEEAHLILCGNIDNIRDGSTIKQATVVATTYSGNGESSQDESRTRKLLTVTANELTKRGYKNFAGSCTRPEANTVFKDSGFASLDVPLSFDDKTCRVFAATYCDNDACSHLLPCSDHASMKR